ncbi:hypothetical protein LCGC14_0989980, partial [marine sediment metagenome]
FWGVLFAEDAGGQGKGRLANATPHNKTRFLTTSHHEATEYRDWLNGMGIDAWRVVAVRVTYDVVRSTRELRETP